MLLQSIAGLLSFCLGIYMLLAFLPYLGWLIKTLFWQTTTGQITTNYVSVNEAKTQFSTGILYKYEFEGKTITQKSEDPFFKTLSAILLHLPFTKKYLTRYLSTFRETYCYKKEILIRYAKHNPQNAMPVLFLWRKGLFFLLIGSSLAINLGLLSPLGSFLGILWITLLLILVIVIPLIILVRTLSKQISKTVAKTRIGDKRVISLDHSRIEYSSNQVTLKREYFLSIPLALLFLVCTVILLLNLPEMFPLPGNIYLLAIEDIPDFVLASLLTLLFGRECFIILKTLSNPNVCFNDLISNHGFVELQYKRKPRLINGSQIDSLKFQTRIEISPNSYSFLSWISLGQIEYHSMALMMILKTGEEIHIGNVSGDPDTVSQKVANIKTMMTNLNYPWKII